MTFTRRTALALMGAGGVAAAATGSASASHGAGNGSGGDQPWYDWEADVDAHDFDLENLHSVETDHVFTAARDADRIVWKDDDGVYHADGVEGEVASGEDFFGVTQAALDSLTEGRDYKEKVAVVSPGEVTQTEGTGLEVPSYTIFDVAAPIKILEGDDLTLVSASDAEHIEIPNLYLDGPVNYAIALSSVTDVVLGNIRLHQPSGMGVRIDGAGSSEERSSDIQVEQIYGVGLTHHLFETRRCDRVQVSQVLAKNVWGCAVLLNETADATIGDVIEYSPDIPEDYRYATFRNTLQEGRVTADNIVSSQAGRGLHIHTGSGELVLNNVYIDGARNRGAVINGPPNTVLNGGIIKNCSGDAISLYTTSDPQSVPERRADGVNITNMRIYDDRSEDERDQTWAINEGGNAQNNRFVNNDVRDGGTEGLIDTTSHTTAVIGNIGAGVAQGTVTLSTGGSPAARVEDIDSHPDVTLELRSKTFGGPETAFQYDHHFEWTGSQWDLVFEWVTDPGEDLTVDYIVDRPQANLGRYPLAPPEYGEGIEDVPEVAATDAPVTDGMVMHLDASTLSEYLGDGDAVKVWSDRSDAGNFANQINEAHQPTYSADAMEGSPAVQFSRADETYLALNAEMVDVSSLTLFAVGQWTGAMDEETYLIGANSPRRLRIANYGNWDGQNVLAWRVGNGDVAFADPDTEPHVFTEDSSMNVYHDGEKAPDIDDENTESGNPADLTLGARQRGEDIIDGNIAEVLLFERELSESEISQVHQYLAGKYDSISLS